MIVDGNEYSESIYMHCKSSAVVTEVLCFSGSNQWTAHPKQQHALTYTSTFWYVLKIFLLLGCAFSTRFVALRSIHPEMQTISTVITFSLNSHARSRVIKIVRYCLELIIAIASTKYCDKMMKTILRSYQLLPSHFNII